MSTLGIAATALWTLGILHENATRGITPECPKGSYTLGPDTFAVGQIFLESVPSGFDLRITSGQDQVIVASAVDGRSIAEPYVDDEVTIVETDTQSTETTIIKRLNPQRN